MTVNDNEAPGYRHGPRLTAHVITLREAGSFISQHHRHHPPPTGHRLSMGAFIFGTSTLVGVATIGNPVAKAYVDGDTWEVNRTCTDGTRNANSLLYGACERLRKALGLARMVTYTQKGESGASLRAAGWRLVHVRAARSGWNRPGRPRNDRHPTQIERYLWLTGTPWPEGHEIAGFCHEMTLTCTACGRSLPKRVGVGRPRITCSEACRARAYRRRRDSVAPDVPTEFITDGGLFGDQIEADNLGERVDAT